MKLNLYRQRATELVYLQILCVPSPKQGPTQTEEGPCAKTVYGPLAVL